MLECLQEVDGMLAAAAKAQPGSDLFRILGDEGKVADPYKRFL